MTGSVRQEGMPERKEGRMEERKESIKGKREEGRKEGGEK